MAVLSASRPAWVVDGVDEGEIGERRKGRKLWKTRVRNVRVVVQIEMGECREIVQLPQPHVRQAGAAVELERGECSTSELPHLHVRQVGAAAEREVGERSEAAQLSRIHTPVIVVRSR